MNLRKYTVFPGQYILTTVPALISTVLGSCVSVCLWDKQTHTGGMNHYLLPGNTSDTENNFNRGFTATRFLIHAFKNRHIDLSQVEAKVFGGCNSLYIRNDLYKVGERNIAMAIDLLQEYNIKIVARHVGGQQGRKIVFNTDTGKVRMRLLTKPSDQINEEINKGFSY